MPEQEYFFCRKGMLRIGPLSRKTLRWYLAAGLIDAQTLVSYNEDGCMLPLGASVAAGEISRTIHTWQRMFSLPIYLLWLTFVPLFSAGVAAFGVYSTLHNWWMLPCALLIAQLGMSYWLWRTWILLLADKHSLTAVLYALPMILPGVNCVWIWIGYMQLPRYWDKYKRRLNITTRTLYWPYYLAMICFYLTCIGTVIIFFTDGDERTLLIKAVGVISWLWFGCSLLSLAIADCFSTRVIQEKLSHLAFGAVRFCANIDYDLLHRTVLTVRNSNRKASRILAIGVLAISWTMGGWFWMHALESTLDYLRGENKPLVNIRNYREWKTLFLKTFPAENTQSTLVNTNADRLGK